ncbi:hypothetical protein JRQ81_012193 [Phrynocephalus forsythii]|uniref:Uncharacterized protein n=1 Tax=Phrynocephalus forsythii TaxID=171643 RepID=A0A9Q1APU0_9SAUR|nr:hypothetical protein JRQ81_012193 [Phrynocephalus forsythii]
MAAEQGIVGDLPPELQAGLEPGGQRVERGLQSPKAEVASEGKRDCSPANLNGVTEKFPNKLSFPACVKEEEEGPTQQGESQWLDFPKEQQSSHAGCGEPRVMEATPWGHGEALAPPFQGPTEASHGLRKEGATRLLLGLGREAQGTDDKLSAREEAGYRVSTREKTAAVPPESSESSKTEGPPEKGLPSFSIRSDAAEGQMSEIEVTRLKSPDDVEPCGTDEDLSGFQDVEGICEIQERPSDPPTLLRGLGEGHSLEGTSQTFGDSELDILW